MTEVYSAFPVMTMLNISSTLSFICFFFALTALTLSLFFCNPSSHMEPAESQTVYVQVSPDVCASVFFFLSFSPSVRMFAFKYLVASSVYMHEIEDFPTHRNKIKIVTANIVNNVVRNIFKLILSSILKTDMIIIDHFQYSSMSNFDVKDHVQKTPSI